jgi:hypothetical protein
LSCDQANPQPSSLRLARPVETPKIGPKWGCILVKVEGAGAFGVNSLAATLKRKDVFIRRIESLRQTISLEAPLKIRHRKHRLVSFSVRGIGRVRFRNNPEDRRRVTLLMQRSIQR